MNKNTLVRIIQEARSLSFPAKQEMLAKVNEAGDDKAKLEAISLELVHLSGGASQLIQTKEQKTFGTR